MSKDKKQGARESRGWSSANRPMPTQPSLDEAEDVMQDSAKAPINIIASSDDDDFQRNMFTLADAVLNGNVDAKSAMVAGTLLGMAHKNRRKPKNERRTLTIVESPPKGICTNAQDVEDAELLPVPVPISYGD